MALVVLTQVAGGVGTTTLAANLTNLWPLHPRILLELGITGGSLMQVMGFDAQASNTPASLSDLLADGYDLGLSEVQAPSLAGRNPERWELPVVPAPVIPDFPRPGEPMWWQKRVDLALSTNLDVIVDLGRVAPEHMGIHNRVLNTAAIILVVVRNIEEARRAVARLTLYQDRLAIVVISRLRSMPQEVTDATGGVLCAEVLPFDEDIATHLWRNALVTESKAKKPSKQYLDGVSHLAHYLRGAELSV
jgi:hypothetical protein